QIAAPRDELQRRINREQPDHQEERELGDERDAVEVIVSALLEIEHAREANDENEARGNAVDAIGRQELPRARGGELAAQQREFHGERRHSANAATWCKN